MLERDRWLTILLVLLSTAACDPVNNPDLFALGVGGGTLIFTILMILFALVVTVISVAVPIVIVVMVMKAMKKSREEKERVLRTGTKATATVLRLSETGTYINNQPMVNIALHVQPPDRAPFEASIQQVLSQLEIPRVQPGQKVAVGIDPDNPQKVVLDLNAPVNVPAFCNYCQKSVPQGARNCPHCGAPINA